MLNNSKNYSNKATLNLWRHLNKEYKEIINEEDETTVQRNYEVNYYF